jgi:hypothetical protein
MTAPPEFEIFLVATPGLEPVLLDEVRAQGFAGAEPAEGGVTCRGGWPEVWRANLVLRGAGRVLVRLGSFRALHLAQLDKRARRFPWAAALRPDVPVRLGEVEEHRRQRRGGARVFEGRDRLLPAPRVGQRHAAGEVGLGRSLVARLGPRGGRGQENDRRSDGEPHAPHGTRRGGGASTLVVGRAAAPMAQRRGLSFRPAVPDTVARAARGGDKPATQAVAGKSFGV